MVQTDPGKAGEVPVLGGVVPYLAVEGATRAAAFYAQAFGATIEAMMPPDDQGRTMHAHLHLNGGSLMLSDFYPEHGHVPVPVQGCTLTLAVDDVDLWWERAVAAGCEVKMALADQFWGKRYGQLRDPFGVIWALSSR